MAKVEYQNLTCLDQESQNSIILCYIDTVHVARLLKPLGQHA